jgi:large subunit ribosomal protein L23
MIAPNATKMDVRNAVQHVYGVRPVAVNIVKMQGKVVRFGRYSGRQVGRKKAIVTLPAGKTIDVTNA